MMKAILLPLFLIYFNHIDQGVGTPSPTENVAPRVVGSIENQIAIAEEAFSFAPVNVFYDEDSLTYSSKTPSFLKFNRDIQEFYGTPQEENIGTYNVSLTATDTGSLSATTYFLLEVAGDDEARLEEDDSSNGGIAAAFSVLGSAVVYGLVDGIKYARWRMKKKMEEEEDDDASSALFSCENYRSECCKGRFKFLSCYNKCECCNSLFSCMCDKFCTKCCDKGSCNCCLTHHQVSYQRASGKDDETISKEGLPCGTHEQNLKVGDISGNSGPISIDNSNKTYNTQNTHHTMSHVTHDNRHSFNTTHNHHHNTTQVLKSPGSGKNEERKLLQEKESSALKDDKSRLLGEHDELNKEEDLDYSIDSERLFYKLLKVKYDLLEFNHNKLAQSKQFKQLDGKEAWFHACRAGELTKVKSIYEDYRADLQAKNKVGWNALILAAVNGRKDIVEYLVEKGADLEATDKDGRTALICAAISGEKDVVEVLVEKGADLEAKNKVGWNALMFAAVNEKKEVVEVLVEKGADLEATDEEGENALILAAYWGGKEVVEVLLEKGAEVNATDKLGWNALMFAENEDHTDIAKLLRAYGAKK